MDFVAYVVNNELRVSVQRDHHQALYKNTKKGSGNVNVTYILLVLDLKVLTVF
jgi:hypothetical protein